MFELAPLAEFDGDSVLDLASAKAHLRVLDNSEDALIGALRDAAVAAVQGYTKLQLFEADREWRGRFCDPLRLGIGPVNEILSIDYLDAMGASIALDEADWRIGLHATVLPAIGALWPATGAGAGVVTITFDAGFADDQVPPTLISAVKMMLTYLFENRDGAIDTARLPPGVRALCDLHRLPTI